MQRFAFLLIAFIFIIGPLSMNAQHSVARQWNEVLLENIRNDFARPTVHARNLFHTSVAMYDIWSAYDDVATPFLIGQSVRGFYCEFDGVPAPTDKVAATNEAISYAMYRLLSHRFANSANTNYNLFIINSKMVELGYDPNDISIDYTSGSPAAFGNYVAKCLIDFGLQDGANEINGYENRYYTPVNDPLVIEESGNPSISNPNNWQPLTLDFFIDQSGNLIPFDTPDFLGPEWGAVVPFSLTTDDLNIYRKSGNDYFVYHDPGRPPYVGVDVGVDGIGEYNWGFSLVSLWSSHLDPNDGVTMDISPGALGNIDDLPTSIAELRDYYDEFNGGDPSTGRAINPKTGAPYPPNIVKRGDYTRVLSEFWADGPDSETPPGHWFSLLNYVNDQPETVKKYKGVGAVLDDLEWDVKTYLTMGGAMHDCAVSAWGIKGYYDYIRPVSAIRYMAAQGQCTDANLGNFTPAGVPLIPGYIEMVDSTDQLVGDGFEHLNKIKIYAWKGPDYIFDPRFDVAGVDWILAENWFPYQRPSFVTPPFAGYVSGHSTFSRAAADVMTMLTGDEYFPGGMGSFVAEQNEFLVFEEGPSEDVVLQWATYQDASDQTSLSRIWGGIHPPADDIPGRIIGGKIGASAFLLAEKYFDGVISDTEEIVPSDYFTIRNNPVLAGDDMLVSLARNAQDIQIDIFNVMGALVQTEQFTNFSEGEVIRMNSANLQAGTHVMRINVDGVSISKPIFVLD